MRTARIIEHREIALRIGATLLRRWGAHMERDELRSLTDLALCEADRRFDDSREVRFSTFLFYFVQNALTREIRFRKRSPQLNARHVVEKTPCHTRAPMLVETPQNAEHSETPSDESPEQIVYHRQLRNQLRVALGKLNPLEKQILVEVDMHDETIAHVARTIGYSREYLSSVRSAACRKLRPLFSEDLRYAA